MSTSNLPAGAFFTNLNGRRCTAVPRNGGGTQRATTTSEPPATSTSLPPTEQTSTTTSSPPPPAQTSTSTPPPAQKSSTRTQTQSLQDSLSTTASVASSSTSLSLPAAVSTPPPEVQNGNEGAGAETETDTGAGTTTQPPPVQSSAPVLSESTPIASFSLISSDTSTPAAPPTPAQTSSADNLDSTAAAVTSTPEPIGNASSSSSPSPVDTEATASNDLGFPLTTTIGTARPSDGAAAVGNGPFSTSDPQVSAVAQSNDDEGMGGMTIAVAGGVVGGVVLISLIAFLIWFMRKRQLRKRRSTLLTPLSLGPESGGSGFPSEKGGGPYIINRGSIGPTARAEKLKASVGYGFRKLRDRVESLVSSGGNGTSAGGVNMNRGNSQFMETGGAARHSRSSSAASQSGQGGRFQGLLGRLTGVFGGQRKDQADGRDTRDPFAGAQSRAAPMTSANNNTAQPDFLTLLGMDDRELQREAQRKRASRNGSASSGDHFLGSLGLNFASEDPFSDNNALAHQSAKPAPLATPGSQPSNANDPFSDSNAIQPPAAAKPSTYVSDVRRSRGPSVSGGKSRPPSTSGGAGAGSGYNRADSYYNRESVNSVESFQTRRNKFRSDPFDLERPELLGRSAKVASSNLSTAGSAMPPRLSTTTTNSSTAGVRLSSDSMIKMPGAAHRRTESFTSKYSSGVSMGDWSDPGPDVGPGASRYDLTETGRSGSPTPYDVGRARSGSGASGGVGKAL